MESKGCFAVHSLVRGFEKITSVNKYLQSPKSGGRYFKNKDTVHFQEQIIKRVHEQNLLIPPEKEKYYLTLGLIFSILPKTFLRRDLSNMIKNVEDALLQSVFKRNDVYVTDIYVSKIRAGPQEKTESFSFFLGFHPFVFCEGHQCEKIESLFTMWKNSLEFQNET